MSRACHPTAEELCHTFDRLLASDGDIVSCTGLDSQTWTAVQQAWGTPALRPAARAELGRQLDGTHRREAETAMRARFAARAI